MATDFTLGTKFIDQHVIAIVPRSRKDVLKDCQQLQSFEKTETEQRFTANPSNWTTIIYQKYCIQEDQDDRKGHCTGNDTGKVSKAN